MSVKTPAENSLIHFKFILWKCSKNALKWHSRRNVLDNAIRSGFDGLIILDNLGIGFI